MPEIKIINMNNTEPMDIATPVEPPVETAATSTAPVPEETVAPVEQTAAPAEQVTAEPTAEDQPSFEYVPFQAHNQPAPAESATPATAQPEAVKDEKWEKIEAAYKAGKLREYLEVATTDYDTVPAEDIIRMDLQSKHPGSDKATIDVLFKREMKKYGFGQEDVDQEESRILLKADADAIRYGLKAKQSEFQIPSAPATETTGPSEAETLAKVEAFAQYVKAHPFTTHFETNRTVKVGPTGEQFAIEAPKELDIVASTIDPAPLYNAMYDSKGVLDMQKWTKLLLYAHDMETFEKTIFNRGRMVGEKASFDGLPDPGARDGVIAAPSAEPRIKITGRS